ncbi:TlpA family protein disulfide reductase [Putridiphycobacter roseus]|uniref:TlpA family protein disulfide reductase n=1 Tax=Putridiphycobacter roseus TaxID=2219161 RepID=A0A2W1NBV3_9FLAO|nr:TlpA disulfide reductase family protein [Putridiphycobacter roseus]PZE16563.1 TlpA family protein disulfide reductase [Putridiphycobacter roseus]
MKNIFFIIALTICIILPTQIQAKSYKVYFQLKKNHYLPVDLNIDNNVFTINNAAEKIKLNHVISQGDSVIVSFNHYESSLIFHQITDKKLTGYWVNYAKSKNYKIPFYGVSKTKKTKINKDLNKYVGRWEATFNYDKPTKLIGEFKLEDNQLRGTFLSETGDYRYLQGDVEKQTLKLSCFDGSHAFLFTAKLKNDTLIGEFYSGNHYKTEWRAFKNENATLRNADSLTYITNKAPISFSLKNTAGKMVNYSNEDPTDKITLIQIFGSWCPNCLDETNLLLELNQEFQDKIQIYGIGFEIEKTEEEKLKRLERFKESIAIPYDILLGGDANKGEATKAFPMLNQIISFPTLIIIDSKGNVQKIHTGFSGPATGEHYITFKEDLYKFIATLD